MEIWERFIEENSITAQLVETYVELRSLLKELGHTEKSAARISSGPKELFQLRAEFVYLQDKLFKQLKSFGFDISENEYAVYLMSKFNKIDLLIPLNDGNYKGDDSGDEDY